MNLKKAIQERRSRRSYLDAPVAPLSIEKLEIAAWECNRSGKLNIQIITNDKEAFGNLKKTYGLFSGVTNYIALVGKKEDPNLCEKLGYYGESLVLLATTLGLGTCWVGATFDKEVCRCKVAEDEELQCVIAFGNVKLKDSLKEKAITKAIHRKSKEIKDMLKAIEQVPNWVVDGMRCVVKAPSARNRMPVMFYYSGGVVAARIKGESLYEFFDLGIAKLHFELGVGKGTWEFGNGGMFEYEHSNFKRESAEGEHTNRNSGTEGTGDREA
ncbi:MAG: nitroreductase family protein [Anaerovoracaceae bacterium]